MSTSNLKADQLKDLSLEEILSLTVDQIAERKHIVFPTGQYLVTIGAISLPDPTAATPVEFFEGEVTVLEAVELLDDEREEEAAAAIEGSEGKATSRFYTKNGHGVVTMRTLYGKVFEEKFGVGASLGECIAQLNESPNTISALLHITEETYTQKTGGTGVRNNWRALHIAE